MLFRTVDSGNGSIVTEADAEEIAAAFISGKSVIIHAVAVNESSIFEGYYQMTSYYSAYNDGVEDLPAGFGFAYIPFDFYVNGNGKLEATVGGSGVLPIDDDNKNPIT